MRYIAHDDCSSEESRTRQYHQVGNAVPPFLAYRLSQIVFNIFEKFFKGKGINQMDRIAPDHRSWNIFLQRKDHKNATKK
jgi:hypothetical protein